MKKDDARSASPQVESGDKKDAGILTSAARAIGTALAKVTSTLVGGEARPVRRPPQPKSKSKPAVNKTVTRKAAAKKSA